MRTALVIVAVLLVPLPALGAAANGFGLLGGAVGHHVQTPVPRDHTSLGLALHGDAQFVIDDAWSLVPLLGLTLERLGDGLEGTASNGMAGLELRRWFGDAYLGGRLGYYVELLAIAGTTGTYYGPGFGLTAGMEWADGWAWAVQVDRPRQLLFSALDARTTLRLVVGRRWH
ncbi:MAG: hypothetical protein HY342_03750 [Candidatus Lambdaproteobacteria bacterium]|nr:hypothetical protein [Candidatus Lambdaproteobacteria bacterium]